MTHPTMASKTCRMWCSICSSRTILRNKTRITV